MYGVRPSGQFGGLAELGGAPLIIIQDQQEKKRLTGHEAHKANLMAGIKVAETVRTSFGPKGMDKIVISQDGDVVVTNDGATILKKMPVEHECARLLVELSQSQDDQIGDGTTGVVILAGALLQKALKLLDKNLHPIKIANGFEKASRVAIARCEEVASRLSLEDEEALVKAAKTSLCSKVVSSESEKLARIVVQAVLAVADKERGDVNLDLIKVEYKPGGRLADTKLVDGIALDKTFSHSQMRTEIQDAKIAILTCPFEPPKPKTKHKLTVKSREAYKELVDKEQEYFKDMVAKVKASGANVVMCQWGFDDEANHLLFQNDLPAVRWVSGNEIELISLATGGPIVPRFEDLTPEKLGTAKCVREISMGTEDDRLVLVEGCPGGRAVTILIRGSNLMATQEAKRCIHDALCVVRNLVADTRVVPGGGAVETACSLRVLEEVKKTTDLDQHAMEAFAEALMAVPEALSENTGLNAVETLGKLRAEQLNQKNPNLGVDCYQGQVTDMLANQVYESLSSKTHQIALATQVVKMILKIDDIIVPNSDQ
ncbi:putative chaperonin containing T-complex 1 delta subunit, tcpd protein [Gregarina niphandrodes]|uniref:T-complex protein 1 subunit epsilon n=1 Tax=Gregarina niphandrodes TaxID=110365 RepID=A0A023B0E0_GRENI|nr:putative chaperonin containing T-complex 1 delta subunit, tcpd protein [Gregarina niphandrodes]EZG45358.1 putative chaperonin containing T-complex 1 delta subunit, tcpd protein [Gregarina niphandrodes]|eukprot:XP_011132516.1 putative chaperonin containing T-complex 1 delta subunit, tcpd protein [Gregarina niphandrodes]